MAWYVFALVEDLPSPRAGAGLRGPLAARRVPGGVAIVERRADVPPIELGTLRKHERVVARLADAARAILPVRFGTLLEMDEIEEALAAREEELAEAFDLVRGRVQFTWRRRPARARAVRAGGADARRTTETAPSGTEYLRRAAARAAPPPVFRAVRDRLRPLVARERYQAATPSLPDSLYHLVDRGNLERYSLLARTLASRTPALRVTGPFAPFAFAPELL